MPDEPIMETLQDFNARRRMEWLTPEYSSGAPVPNGIACPKCGKPLHDSHPGEMLYSDPGQIRVACADCGYCGLRVA